MNKQITNPVHLTAEEFMHPGNRACSGCGLATLYRIGLKALGRNSIFVVPPSCLTVMQGLYPIAATQIPCLNVTFASTAAAASGVRAAMKVRGKDNTHVVAWAGDGGTSDIGIQSLSAAIERGEDFLYICYDNEAYMNTGVQRSGTTPRGAYTTNTPIKGKLQKNKDLPTIIAAHKPTYVATCSAAYPLDFHNKILKAVSLKGLKYIHIHTPCPSGWGMEERLAITVGKMAVNAGLYDLYEVEDGKKVLSGPSAKLLKRSELPPVADYLKTQARFRSLSEDQIADIQAEIDAKWAQYRQEMG